MAECKNPENCVFRHSELAKKTLKTCKEWSNGKCDVPNCPLRHSNYHIPTLTTKSNHQQSNPINKRKFNTYNFSNKQNELNKADVPCYYEQNGGCTKLNCPYKHGLVKASKFVNGEFKDPNITTTDDNINNENNNEELYDPEKNSALNNTENKLNSNNSKSKPVLFTHKSKTFSKQDQTDELSKAQNNNTDLNNNNDNNSTHINNRISGLSAQKQQQQNPITSHHNYPYQRGGGRARSNRGYPIRGNRIPKETSYINSNRKYSNMVLDNRNKTDKNISNSKEYKKEEHNNDGQKKTTPELEMDEANNANERNEKRAKTSSADANAVTNKNSIENEDDYESFAKFMEQEGDENTKQNKNNKNKPQATAEYEFDKAQFDELLEREMENL